MLIILLSVKNDIFIQINNAFGIILDFNKIITPGLMEIKNTTIIIIKNLQI
jgi:hypothetical protein